MTGRLISTIRLAAIAAVCLLVVAAPPASARPRGWTIQTLPSLPVGELFGVSCAAPDACDAVGLGSPGTLLYGALADRWDGSSWSQIEADSTRYSQPSPLRGVSCPASEMCMAVGDVVHDEGADESFLAQTLTATGIQDVSPPPIFLPPEGDGLTAVSCTSATVCVAVGSSGLTGFQTLIERWDGTAWAVQTAAPQPDLMETLLGVSCSSPSFCVAVGGWNADALAGTAMAESWDGSAWSLGQVPTPPGTQTTALDSVSCPRPGDCVAVGVSRDQSKNGHALIERLHGGRWTLVRAPSPAGAVQTGLGGVSCPDADVCTAVGSATDANGTAHSLALRLDHGHVRLESTPVVPGAAGDSLAAVSCPSREVCTAVGQAILSPPPSSIPYPWPGPLAERWVGGGRRWGWRRR